MIKKILFIFFALQFNFALAKFPDSCVTNADALRLANFAIPKNQKVSVSEEPDGQGWFIQVYSCDQYYGGICELPDERWLLYQTYRIAKPDCIGRDIVQILPPLPKYPESCRFENDAILAAEYANHQTSGDFKNEIEKNGDGLSWWVKIYLCTDGFYGGECGTGFEWKLHSTFRVMKINCEVQLVGRE